MDNEWVYRTERADDSVYRASLDGTGVEKVIDTVQLNQAYFSAGIVFDTTGAKMYWVDSQQPNSRIRRANLDGTEVEDLATNVDGVVLPETIALVLPPPGVVPGISVWGLAVIALAMVGVGSVAIRRRQLGVSVPSR